MGSFQDLTGQVFGKLTVIRRIENHVSSGGHSFPRYECLCDCGNYKNVTALKLRTGHVKSCGKCGAFSNFKDLTGKTFDKLYVEKLDGYYEYPNGERDYKWKCRCECGNYVTVRGNSLKASGRHCCKRCSNEKNRVKDEDMLYKVFGKLTVLSKAASTYTKSNTVIDWWNCRCECGSELKVRGASLRNGHTASCGCQRLAMLAESQYESHHERVVRDLLDKHDCVYLQQKTFCDLIGLGGKLLSYDFCVYKHDTLYLIELNGLQHYKPVNFFGGHEGFARQMAHDLRKKQYAETHGYPLLTVRCVGIKVDDLCQQVSSFLNL